VLLVGVVADVVLLLFACQLLLLRWSIDYGQLEVKQTTT